MSKNIVPICLTTAALGLPLFIFFGILVHVAALASMEIVSLISVGAGFSGVSSPETIIKNSGVTFEELRLKNYSRAHLMFTCLLSSSMFGLTFLNSTELSNNGNKMTPSFYPEL